MRAVHAGVFQAGNSRLFGAGLKFVHQLAAGQPPFSNLVNALISHVWTLSTPPADFEVRVELVEVRKKRPVISKLLF